MKMMKSILLIFSSFLVASLNASDDCDTILKEFNAKHVISSSYRGCNDSLLKLASSRGDLQVVQCALDQDSTLMDVDDHSPSSSQTPLICASLQGHLQVVQLLIEHGADVNYADSNGFTSLIRASEGGYLSVVQYLVEHGADVNHTTSGGWAAILCSSLHNRLKVAEYLMEHGADIHHANSWGKTPFDYATPEMKTLLKQYDHNKQPQQQHRKKNLHMKQEPHTSHFNLIKEQDPFAFHKIHTTTAVTSSTSSSSSSSSRVKTTSERQSSMTPEEKTEVYVERAIRKSLKKRETDLMNELKNIRASQIEMQQELNFITKILSILLAASLFVAVSFFAGCFKNHPWCKTTTRTQKANYALVEEMNDDIEDLKKKNKNNNDK